MAKRLSKAEREAQRNLAEIEKYVASVNLIYDEFLEEIVKLAARLPRGINSLKVFSFDDFPALQKKLDELIKKTSVRVFNSIGDGADAAVIRANAKNDALVDAVFKASKIPKTKLAKYYDRNLSAAVTRRTKSQLSKRVYKITKQFSRVAEMGIDIGIANGTPARQLASEIRKSVKDPDFAFRRVRNKKGELEWSKAAKKFKKENPEASGPGKYLNPQKNFERLTRTEINMSYRTADFERMAELDFIVGYRINLSTNPNHCPLCIQLAGDYPKNFLFRGWHPQCRCYATTILKTPEELEKDMLRIIAGKEPLQLSLNTVKRPHTGFTKWLRDNEEKITNMQKRGTLSYWLQDNFKKGNYTVSGIQPGKVVGGL